jgi:hypothetical protein
VRQTCKGRTTAGLFRQRFRKNKREDKMPPEKHTVYINLQDAFMKNGCAFCNILEKNTLRYFDNMLFEKITAKETAGEMLKSNGFCGRHSMLLLDLKDAMSTAQLYGRVMEPMIALLKRKSPGEFLSGYGRILETQNRYCPACLHEKLTLERYVGVFMDFKEDFIRIFEEDKFPFCIGHFSVVLEKLEAKDHPDAVRLCEIQRSGLEGINDGLGVLVNSFNTSKETVKPDEKQKKSWVDAVELISGKTIRKLKKWKK